MKKKKNVGISIFAAVVMTVGLVFGGHTSFEAQAVKTCEYARCHIDSNKCLPGNAVSARPRCSTIKCHHALGCNDPYTVTIE
jgi:hypothetical protein